jgi:hypothetical protein
VIPGTAPDRRRRGGHAGFRPSKFDGKTLPDFVDALFKRIKSGVKGSVVKVKNIAARESPEDPVVALHVNQHLLNRVPHGGNCAQQTIHRIPRPKVLVRSRQAITVARERVDGAADHSVQTGLT